MEYVGGHEPEGHPAARREAQRRHADAAAAGAGHRLHARDPPGASATCTPAGCCSATSSSTTSSRPQHSLKLIDLGGVYRIDDPSSPIYGTVGLPGPGDRADRARRSPPTSTRSARTLALLCIDFAGLPERPSRHSLPPAGVGARCFGEFDSLYRLLAQGHGARPRRPLPVGRRDGRPARRRPARGRRAPRTAPPSRGRARCSAATCARVPTGPTGGACRSCASTPTTRPPATWPRSRRPSPPTSSRLLRSAPDQTVEVELRLARALIDAGEWDAAAHDARRDRRGRPLGVARGVGRAASPSWHAAAERRAPRLPRGLPRGARRAGAEAGARPIALELARATCGGAPRGTRSSSRTDPGFTTAAFGLARCRLATGDRAGALAAYDRVSRRARAPTPSAQVAGDPLPARRVAPDVADAACGGVDRWRQLTLDPRAPRALTTELLVAALALVDRRRRAGRRPESALARRARWTERDLARRDSSATYRSSRVTADDATSASASSTAPTMFDPRTWT